MLDPARRWRRVRYANSAPMTAIALPVALAVRLAGGAWRVVDGVLEVGGGRVGRGLARTRIDAITFGHVVLGVDLQALERWRDHEHVHVDQYERFGVAFPLLYLLSSVHAWWRGRDPYRANVFEREARIGARAASRHRRAHVSGSGALHSRP
jgi:hypothetical protein